MKSKMLSRSEDNTVYAVIFDTGDELIKGLTEFAKERRLDASHFTAVGGFSSATLGYFDVNQKEYKKIPVEEQVEVLTLAGDIALDKEKGEPKVHAHVVLGKADGSTIGGHVMKAAVRPTLEIVLEESPAHLRRVHDPVTGLALIDV
jgi:predicted DNA-binding protein with PD1-like motif